MIFEKEHINTRLMANEMLISMMSAFAQEESVSIAKNLRKGILMRMSSGNFRMLYGDGCAIRLDSRVGCGTRVELEIPLFRNAAETQYQQEGE